MKTYQVSLRWPGLAPDSQWQIIETFEAEGPAKRFLQDSDAPVKKMEVKDEG